MPIIDRYVLRLFLKVLIVALCSLTGLYVVIDTFNNLEEFLTYGRTEGGVLAVLFQYYGPHALSFFDRTSSLLTLVAAMFAITWLQRSNELTAIMAAGISPTRILRPLVGASLVVSLLAVVNREAVIPLVRDRLMRNAQDWLGESARSVQSRFDLKTNILIDGRSTYAAEERISEPRFHLPPSMGSYGRKLVGENAIYYPPTDERPGGYWFRGVTQPENIAELPSVVGRDGPLVLSPSDTDWLEPDECFVVSGIDFERLEGGNSWRRYSSTPELISSLRNTSLDYGADVRVTIHSRFVQPLLDMALMFLGLPLVMTRQHRNVFVAAGLCLLLVAVFFTVILACHALGNHGYLLSPVMAAWCPLFLFVPAAFATARPLWD